MTAKEKRSDKEKIAQLIFLEMNYVFRKLKPNSKISEELYKPILSDMQEKGRNNKYRRLMFGHDTAYKFAKKGMRQFGFSYDLCEFKSHGRYERCG